MISETENLVGVVFGEEEELIFKGQLGHEISYDSEDGGTIKIKCLRILHDEAQRKLLIGDKPHTVTVGKAEGSRQPLPVDEYSAGTNSVDNPDDKQTFEAEFEIGDADPSGVEL